MRKVASVIAALVTIPALAQQPTAPASLVREGVTEKLTDHVWAIPDGGASLVPNVGIVVGKKAVLVIDTGMGTRNGADGAARSREGRRRQAYLHRHHARTPRTRHGRARISRGLEADPLEGPDRGHRRRRRHEPRAASSRSVRRSTPSC